MFKEKIMQMIDKNNESLANCEAGLFEIETLSAFINKQAELGNIAKAQHNIANDMLLMIKVRTTMTQMSIEEINRMMKEV